MKFQFKALSLTLGLVALLGACTSVNSSTPSSEIPSADSSVELEGTADELGQATPEELEVEATDLEASEEGAFGDETAGMEEDTTELEASEEGEFGDETAETEDEWDAESAEMEDKTEELEAADDTVVEPTAETEAETDVESAEGLDSEEVSPELEEVSPELETVPAQ